MNVVISMGTSVYVTCTYSHYVGGDKKVAFREYNNELDQIENDWWNNTSLETFEQENQTSRTHEGRGS